MSASTDPMASGHARPEAADLSGFSGVPTDASHEAAPERDVMAPWGEAGPPGRDWAPDILGPGFSSRTIELLDDAEGECVATLVRATPTTDARVTVLYLHGRNDYFFQTEMAQRLSAAGAAFAPTRRSATPTTSPSTTRRSAWPSSLSATSATTIPSSSWATRRGASSPPCGRIVTPGFRRA